MTGDISVVIGSAALVFLASYWFFKLGKITGDEHLFLQLIMTVFVIGGLVVLGGAVSQASLNCEWVVESMEEDEGGIDQYTYTEVCRDESTGISNTFFVVVTWFYRLFIIYLFLYLIFKVFRLFYSGVNDEDML